MGWTLVGWRGPRGVTTKTHVARAMAKPIGAAIAVKAIRVTTKIRTHANQWTPLTRRVATTMQPTAPQAANMGARTLTRCAVRLLEWRTRPFAVRSMTSSYVTRRVPMKTTLRRTRAGGSHVSSVGPIVILRKTRDESAGRHRAVATRCSRDRCIGPVGGGGDFLRCWCVVPHPSKPRWCDFTPRTSGITGFVERMCCLASRRAMPRNRLGAGRTMGPASVDDHVGRRLGPRAWVGAWALARVSRMVGHRHCREPGGGWMVESRSAWLSAAVP